MDISFIGLRPGEKLDEELFNKDEVVEKTSHPKISKAVRNGGGNSDTLEWLNNRGALGNESAVRNALLQYAVNTP
jgi:FlaA1/EpsC-like NDP-sugar epimerase